MYQAPLSHLEGPLLTPRSVGSEAGQPEAPKSLPTRYRFIDPEDTAHWAYARLVNLCGTGAAFSAEGAWHLVESFGEEDPPEVELELLLDELGKHLRITASVVWVRPGDDDSSDWVGVRFDELPAPAIEALREF